MSVLREQQKEFAQFIKTGEGERFAQTIDENGLSGERRLTIYQRGVSIGFCDALGGVYGAVKKLIGDEFFDHVAEHFWHKHFSQTGNVHDFGAELPEFLAGFPGLETLPYLPDVARLEWHYHTAFHSPTGEMLNIERLSQVPETLYGQLNLLLSPSCYLFSSEYPVLRIWRVNQDEYQGDQTVSLDEGGEQLAIVREGKHIVFHPLEPAAFAMLEAISVGARFDQACEIALGIDPDCDVGQALKEAVLNRIIVGFAVHE